MDFFEAVRKRRAIRAFSNKAAEESKLGQILEAANSAPSAGNLQSYEIFLIRKDSDKAALSEAGFRQKSITLASAVLVFCADVEI